MKRTVRAATLASADRIGAAVLAVFGAAAALNEAASGPTSLSVTLAASGVLGAAAGLIFKVLYERANRRESRRNRWRASPQRVQDMTRGGRVYELGVDLEAPESLAMLGARERHAHYVEREIDDALRDAKRVGLESLELAARVAESDSEYDDVLMASAVNARSYALLAGDHETAHAVEVSHGQLIEEYLAREGSA